MMFLIFCLGTGVPKAITLGTFFKKKKDFNLCGFPSSLERTVDSTGDGVRTEFPIKVRLFLSRSPKNYTW